MINLRQKLERQCKLALMRAFPKACDGGKLSGKPINPQLVRTNNPEFGDYQINAALQLTKILKKAPRDIATSIVTELTKNEEFASICDSPKIAGPGFINLTIKPERLIQELITRLEDNRLGIPLAETNDGKRITDPIIVDFSSPNIAKEMHVGHLRSTIIGDSIARVLEFRGHNVLRLNHVGDWGTQFGMLINHLKSVAPEALTKANAIDIGDLVNFYRKSKERFDSDNNFRERSREEVVNLQNGDPTSLKAWKLLCKQSRDEFQKIYDRLDVRLTERGESFYNEYLQDVVDDLDALNLLVKDDGARCVFLEGILGKNNKPLAIIIQKSDGGFNYATTDLAAIRYRLNPSPKGDGACRVIYVTDSGQSNHFNGVFQIADRANWIPTGKKIEHVPFGLVQGEDGKKLKTRSGETIKLKSLLDEAVNRAEFDLRRRLKEEDRKESESFIKLVSETVGIGAVKYADLSQNRITNYQFSFDKMLALHGNTAPYLLYAVVRIAGIVRKGGSLATIPKQLEFTEKQEWDLVKELLKFDDAINDVEEELLPNRLCNYLYELCQVFNRFYDQLPVLKAKGSSKSSRLALCLMTTNTLKLGMNLLGIPTLERM